MSRRRAAVSLALLLTVALAAVACGDDNNSSASSSKPDVKIATQGFGESLVAGQLYGQVLKANGFPVHYQTYKERASIYTALDGGDVNFVPEYAASALEFLNHNAGEASPDLNTTMSKLAERLAPKKLKALEPSKAVDTNSLVVTKKTAEKYHLTSISDLKDTMKLGGPQDCPTNGSCIPPLKSVYGLDMLKNFLPLDAGGPLTKKSLLKGDIDVAVLFSTDSSIAQNHWVVLKDDKSIFKSDNIVPVVTNDLGSNSELVKLANEVSAKLTTENVTAMNKQFDIDREDVSTIAKNFLSKNGLL